MPKSKMTWFIIAFAVYALLYWEDSTVSNNPKDSDYGFEFKFSQETSQFLEAPAEAVINQMRQTRTGRAVIEAVISESVKDEYGDLDFSTLASQQSQQVLTFDRQKGEGNIAYCGSKVKVHTESFLEQHIKFDSTRDGDIPMEFKIGEGKVIPGLERGVIGMRKGGKRKIVVPAELAYGHPDFQSNFLPKDKPIVVEVELLELDNEVNINKAPIIEDIVKGLGEQISCADTVKISYKLGYQDGQHIKITDPRVIQFTIGKGQVPVGLEQGVIGMLPGGTRGLVLDPSIQLTSGNHVSKLIPETELFPIVPMVTFEVELLAKQ